MSEKSDRAVHEDAEIKAIAAVIGALVGLPADAQNRVLEYSERRLGLRREPLIGAAREDDLEPRKRTLRRARVSGAAALVSDDDWLAGVCYSAQKWMQRHDLTPAQMSTLYRLKRDEIFLKAETVPGKSMKARFRNVILLQGVASYLHRGIRRIDPRTLKLTIARYSVDPGNNFNTYLKSLTTEMSGSKTLGLALTLRGLNSAKGLIKQMASATQ